MSKAKWGGIIVIAVVVAIIVLLGSGVLRTGNKPTEYAVSGSVNQGDGDSVSQGDGDSVNQGEGASVSQEEGDSVSQEEGDNEQDRTTKNADETTGSNTGSATDGDQSETALQKEAESYVQQLTESSDLPLEVHHAEGFVTPDQTLASSTADTGEMQAGEPIENAEVAMTEESAQPQAAEVRVAEATSRADASGSGGTQGGLQTTVDLPLNEQAPITIADIVGSGPDVRPDAVYYVHTVGDADVQGIWGIVQQGVVENFAQGVAVRRGGRLNTYRVAIPRNADELRQDQSSSFLGRLIYEKSRESYVYNFETGRIGRNPDFVTPGQEIVIVSFAPEELIEIYKHFAQSDGQG
jgi:hypothetical protein